MKTKLLTLILLILNLQSYSQLNSWVQKLSLPGKSRVAAMNFYDAPFAFVCTGIDSNYTLLGDNWQYDPANDSWIQKTIVPFARRAGGIAFTVGSKSYCGFGFLISGLTTNDLWEYDKANDSWTQKANCPGSPRALSNSFVIGSLAYVTCGVEDDQNDIYLHDCWEFDAMNNAWNARADFPGNSRVWPVSFVIDGEAYVGTGSDSVDNAFADFYRYDNLTDVWTQLSDCPLPRAGAIGCSLYNTGYIGLGFNSGGSLNDLWSYDKTTDSWNQAATFPGHARDAAFMFATHDKLYVGGGEDQHQNFLRDLWEYYPDTSITGISKQNPPQEISVVKKGNELLVTTGSKFSFPLSLELYSVTGAKLLSQTIYETISTIEIKQLTGDNLIYKIEDDNGKIVSGKVKY